jgi:hypothetical protein
MKKFWKYSVIFFFVFGFFAPSGFVRADALSECVGAQITIYSYAHNGSAPDKATQDSYADFCKNNNNQPPNKMSCDWSLGGIGNCFMAVLASVSSFILRMMALVLWLAGSMLDWVLNYSIVQMSANISGMTGINIVWKVIRDLSNIAFIFILLYEAILIIISRSSKEKMGGIVAGIVITALLINFSLFFTKVIIDASNVVTLGFYQSIMGNDVSKLTSTASDTTNNYTIPQGIAGIFMNDLHVVSFFTGMDVTKLNSTNNDYKTVTLVSLGGSILFLVLSFVFFAISIMYLMRYIILVVLMMSAPIGYLGFGLPVLKGPQSTWWKTLMGQCIFAPLWMFCAWAILILAGSPGFLTLSGGATLDTLGKNGSFTTLISGSNGSAQSAGIPLVINFGLIIGLVIGSLTLAKQKAGQGSALISKYTGQVTAFAGGAIMGAGAMAGRNTIGRAANVASNNEWLKNKAATNVFARAALKASNRTAESTFDARKTTAVKQATSTLGINLGKATDTNLRKIQAAKAESAEKFAKTLKPSDEVINVAKNNTDEAKKLYDNKNKELLDENFVREENEAKKAYLESDAYKNGEIYKNAEKEKADNEAKLKPVKEKEEILNKELEQVKKNASIRASVVGKKQADAEVAAKEQELALHKQEMDKVKKEIAANNTAVKAKEEFEKNWATDKKRKLQEEASVLKKSSDEAATEQKRVEGLGNERIKAYANDIAGSQNHIYKYAAAIGAGVAGVTAGAPVLTTAGAGYLGYRLYTHATNWKGDRKAQHRKGKEPHWRRKERAGRGKA